MRQLDLFGFDSEPQPVAPPQKKKAVTVVPAPAPAPASTPDSNTLVFADDKIGIKIKLKREISVVDDTTPDAPVPKMGDLEPELETENDGPLLQQLTLEDAIREISNETAVQPEIVATEAFPAAEPQQVNEVLNEDSTPDSEEFPVEDVVTETTVADETIAAVSIPAEETVEAEIKLVEEEKPVEETAVTAAIEVPVDEIADTIDTAGIETVEHSTQVSPVAEEMPAVTDKAEEIQELTVAEEVNTVVTELETIAESGTEQVAAEHPQLLKLVKPAVITVEEEEVREEAKPVVLSRPFLARPAVIEISSDVVEEIPEQESVVIKEEAPVSSEESAEEQEEIQVAGSQVVAEAESLVGVENVVAGESAEENNITEEVANIEDSASEEEQPAEVNERAEAVAEVQPEIVQEDAENTGTPANEHSTKVSESIAASVAEKPVADQVESFSAIVEEAAAKQQQPAKIKAPKLQSSREPVAPKKRGRKSFKEIDAESDLIQLPDDEALFEKQYYPISVVAGWFNVNASLLRFWENEFDILKPRKNRKGDRLFRPEDVKNLQVIYYLLRQRKFTIEGAKEYLKTNKKKADTNTQLIQSLNKLRGFLLEFKANIQA